MKAKLAIVAGAAILALILLPASVASADPGGNWGHSSDWSHSWHHDGDHKGQGSGGTIVALESGPYGQVLVVGGNGAGLTPATSTTPTTYIYPAGSALYTPTIDPLANDPDDPYHAGCDASTQAVSVLEENGDPAITGPPFPPFTCAGPETDPTADWPALTTDGPPVAGPGVNRRLLGSVYRADIKAFQVTYGGHPLYLFDPGPNSFAGEAFFETVPPLFPWHTAWYLVSPDGTLDSGAAALTTQTPQAGTDYSAPVLSNTMLPALGGVPVTVYTFSRDRRWHSECQGSCARTFIPVLTTGPPTVGTGIDTGAVGTITRSDGTQQVTYHGQPLYMYTGEEALMGVTGPATVGNGNGVHAFGGTFSSVTP